MHATDKKKKKEKKKLKKERRRRRSAQTLRQLNTRELLEAASVAAAEVKSESLIANKSKYRNVTTFWDRARSRGDEKA